MIALSLGAGPRFTGSHCPSVSQRDSVNAAAMIISITSSRSGAGFEFSIFLPYGKCKEYVVAFEGDISRQGLPNGVGLSCSWKKFKCPPASLPRLRYQGARLT